MTFLEWYADQFDAGAVNRQNYAECASYLEGMRDAGDYPPEAVSRLDRCISVIRAAGNMVNQLHNEHTPGPKSQ